MCAGERDVPWSIRDLSFWFKLDSSQKRTIFSTYSWFNSGNFLCLNTYMSGQGSVLLCPEHNIGRLTCSPLHSSSPGANPVRARVSFFLSLRIVLPKCPPPPGRGCTQPSPEFWIPARSLALLTFLRAISPSMQFNKVELWFNLNL